MGDDGVVYTAEYLTGDEVDRESIMAARAADIEAAVTSEQEKQGERKVAEAAVAVVLGDAVKSGKISEQTLGKAGFAVAAVEVELKIGL